MGLFDSLKKAAGQALKSEVNRAVSKSVNQAVNNAVNNVQKSLDIKNVSFTFSSLPAGAEELKALPEASLDTPFKTAALTLLALMSYESNKQAAIDMLNVLKGPEPVNPMMLSFLDDRLRGRQYTVSSFFEGANADNGYTPSKPYKLTIIQNPYSYPEENWAVMHVQSSGADSLRQIKLRKKPSTGQWFLNDIQCLSEIRVPKEADPWA